ncbi:hypothetical protein J9332_38045, partial [Aquimarina celericrescens]|nr:hypothetical protein [Aquimarina celericrescens]
IFPVVGDGSSVRNFGGASLIIQGEQNAAGFEPTPASLGVEGFTTLYRARKQFSEKFVSNLLFVNDSRNTLVTQDVSTDPTVATVDRPIEIGPDFTDFSKGYLVTKYSNIKSTGQPGSNVTF